MRVSGYNRILRIFAFGVIIYGFGSCLKPAEKDPISFDYNEIDPEKLFTFEVFPLLESKCFACHGNDENDIEGNFDMRSHESIIKGGESGKSALVPHHAEKSSIYQAVSWQDPDFQMPPKENDRLTAQQIAQLEAWINAGAPWPNESRRAQIIEMGGWDYQGEKIVKTSGGLSPTWDNRRYKEDDLWAFYPLTKPEIPGAAKNPIDGFINRKLQSAGLKPTRKADKRTFIRRASFDLTGLPPSPESVNFFLKNNNEKAWADLIDTLLSSPQYGEQWGRHWLDVVRYADTDGFSNDYIRPNAWRYRDYVIRSFNQDKGYDQFLMEQIAGDEIDPTNPELLIAAGFLRMGPWEHTSMSIAAETRQYFLDDVTNAVGETFLSLPLRCARCHDHKFDPLPTRDYYQIQAVFASTQFANRAAAFLQTENRINFEEEKKQIQLWLEETEAEQNIINEKRETAAKQWYTEKGKKYIPKRERMKLPEGKRPPRYYGLDFKDLGYSKVLSKRRQTLNREMSRFDSFAFSVYSGPDRPVHSARPMNMPEEIEDDTIISHILTGGSVYAKGQEVIPGVLSAIESLAENPIAETPLPIQNKGRRLAFAQWLVENKNPLVIRSIVNRIWQYHFGKGLAGNANNFGITGQKPTHPELLDWLCFYFVENDWSMKKLHKLIMTSEVYQRSSNHSQIAKFKSIDPKNDLLAVFSPRRLEAEEMRDAMLAVSGELNSVQGGIPIRPEINFEVAIQPRHIMGSIARAYQPSPKRSQRNRRTIYAEKLRGLPDPMLTVFNQPSSDLSCEKRVSSSVTPQVFSLFNSQIIRDRALAMAVRLEKENEDRKMQIKNAFELTFNRPATQSEVDKSTQYLKKMIAYHQERIPKKREYPLEITRTMFEEMTGESFNYTEKLDIYQSFEPDVKPWAVQPETRALGDLCHALLNANEFMYVY